MLKVFAQAGGKKLTGYNSPVRKEQKKAAGLGIQNVPAQTVRNAQKARRTNAKAGTNPRV